MSIGTELVVKKLPIPDSNATANATSLRLEICLLSPFVARSAILRIAVGVVAIRWIRVVLVGGFRILGIQRERIAPGQAAFFSQESSFFQPHRQKGFALFAGRGDCSLPPEFEFVEFFGSLSSFSVVPQYVFIGRYPLFLEIQMKDQ